MAEEFSEEDQELAQEAVASLGKELKKRHPQKDCRKINLFVHEQVDRTL